MRRFSSALAISILLSACERQVAAPTMTAAAPRAATAQAASVISFDSVSVASGHSCGLDVSGNAYCWGGGNSGELGYGGFGRLLVPVKAVGGVTFRSIAAGSSHTCALTQTSTAYCWGRNDVGQLGFIPDVNSSQCTLGVPCEPVPKPVAGSISFQSLNAGGHTTCGIDGAGTAYCWGSNIFGQVGDGTTINRTTPTPVAGGLTFKNIKVGIFHTCATTNSNEAYCWGYNNHGQLGNASTNSCQNFQPYPCNLTPLRVSGGTSWEIVDAGTVHTCGLSTSGQAFCWGWNGAGQLGDGTNNDSQNPVAVNTSERFKLITAGDIHSCAINVAGTAFCFGLSGAQPTPGSVVWRSLSVDDNHFCGAATDATGYCWGRENVGELGQGGSHQDAEALPTPVFPPDPGLVPPQANIVFSCIGLTCTLDASTSSDDKGIASYSWDFGDGTTGSGAIVSHTYAAPSNQLVWLTVVDTDGLTTRNLTSLFDVDATNRSPQLSFTIASDPACTGSLAVMVDARGSSDPDGDPLSYRIDFGDGSTTTAPALCHNYSANGTYIVTAQVWDPSYMTDREKQVVMEPFSANDQIPVARMSLTCNGRTCNVDGSRSTDDRGITGYRWDFGDGTSAVAGVQAQHTYANANPYKVKLVVSDTRSQPGLTTDLTVPLSGGGTNQPPVASFTYSCSLSGHQCAFNAGSSTDDHGVTAYSWKSSVAGLPVKSGVTVARKTGPTLQRTWLETLTVSDAGGLTNVVTRAIIAPEGTNQAPNANISAPVNNTSVTAGLAVMFSGTANDPELGALGGNALQWRSTLDGAIGSGSSFSTSALRAGTHTITLTALDTLGAAGTASITLTVTSANKPPVAKFTTTCNATQHYCDLDASTSSDPDGTITAYRWTAAGRPTNTKVTIRRVSKVPGQGQSYSETLEVTDNRGAKTRITKTIVIP